MCLGADASGKAWLLDTGLYLMPVSPCFTPTVKDGEWNPPKMTANWSPLLIAMKTNSSFKSLANWHVFYKVILLQRPSVKDMLQLRWSYVSHHNDTLASLLYEDLVKLGFYIEQSKAIPKKELLFVRFNFSLIFFIFWEFHELYWPYPFSPTISSIFFPTSLLSQLHGFCTKKKTYSHS